MDLHPEGGFSIAIPDGEVAGHVPPFASQPGKSQIIKRQSIG